MPVLSRPSRVRVAGAREYVVAAVAVAIAMGVSWIVPALRERTPFLMIVGAVIFSAFYGGLGPGIFATVVGGLATDYVLVPPLYEAVGNPGDLERLAVVFLIGVVTSVMGAELRGGIAQRDELLRTAEGANRAKDEFLAMVSHELASPLSAIRMWVGALRSGRLDEAHRLRGLAAIDDCVAVQTRLIADLLDVSRFISGKFSLQHDLVDVAAAARSALDACRATAAEKRIAMEAHVDADGLVWGDAARIQQVVSNLVSNAVKFTPAGGRVALHVERVADDVRLTVRDTGEGIAPAALPRIFDRFGQEDSTTTRRHGGLGLGLAIAHHLVEAHGGRIEAHSAGKGQGATFVVTLPLAPHVDGVIAGATGLLDDDPVDESRLDGVTVVVVEDDRRTREAIVAVLERAGAFVRAAESAAAALAAVASGPADVLVTDIAMPEEDGYGLLARLRESGATIPVAALTGIAATDERARGLAAGFGAYLTKPVNAARLVRTIAELAVVH